jgi:hypothetical protein
LIRFRALARDRRANALGQRVRSDVRYRHAGAGDASHNLTFRLRDAVSSADKRLWLWLGGAAFSRLSASKSAATHEAARGVLQTKLGGADSYGVFIS